MEQYEEKIKRLEEENKKLRILALHGMYGYCFYRGTSEEPLDSLDEDEIKRLDKWTAYGHKFLAKYRMEKKNESCKVD